MKAFTLSTLKKCLLTGKVEAHYSFALPGADVTVVEQIFNDETSAKAMVNASARDWLLLCIDNFYIHKKQIIEGGHHPNQDKPLQIVNEYISDWHKNLRPLKHIATDFLKALGYFEAILPHPNNNSYNTSLHQLTEITTFCKQYLKQ